MIETVATEPLKAEGDQGKAEQHPLPDLIATDSYLTGKRAVCGANTDGGKKSGGRLLRPAQLVPGGAVQ
jgi:hypothetical protein